MNDIDFDELDKAVSSLMGGVGPDKDDSAPKQKTLSISTTLEPGQSPTYNKLDEVAKGIGSETLVTSSDKPIVATIDDEAPAVTVPTIGVPALPVAAPSTNTQPESKAPANKRDALVTPRGASGKFMDVMHSSSDMRTGTRDDKLSPALQSEADAEAADEAVQSVEIPEESTLQPESAPEPVSPFLPDAKVDKRPLGEPVAVGTSSEPVKKEEPALEEPIQTPQIEPVVEEAPEEIIAINSDALKKEEDTKDAQEVIDPTRIELQDEQSKRLQEVESSEAMVATQADTGSLQETDAASGSSEVVPNATDLPPQTAGGAIYDTKEYHQPLGHPAKKKSGWGVVVIIVIIILLAIALGAAAYFILGLGV